MARLGSMPVRLVVLVSGSGSNLQALLDACSAESYGCGVVAVGSDKPDAGGLARAETAGVETFVVPFTDYSDRREWDAALADGIAKYDPDLVVLAGFMRIVGAPVLDRFPARLVNTHPALLPSFPGAHAVRDALAYGVKVTGVTVHLVDAGVDTGPIIAQASVAVLRSDDEATLHERIKSVERRLLVDAVGRLARDGYRVEGRKVILP
jgi:phosphoribosylglycinamide formyltransferase-1